jgi:hypothetical protein
MVIEFLSIASIVRDTVVPAAALSDRVPPGLTRTNRLFLLGIASQGESNRALSRFGRYFRQDAKLTAMYVVFDESSIKSPNIWISITPGLRSRGFVVA